MSKRYSDRDGDDLVKLYFDDIGKRALLTKDEEVVLAKRIEAGVAAQERLDADTETKARTGKGSLSVTERREQRRIAADGEEAKKEFLTANLRLVVSIAKRYTSSGMTLLDLVQEGNLGLMHAIDKFDWRKGFKFSTYATWWIRQAISRGISNTGHTIRIPVHAEETIQRIRKTKAFLEGKFMRPPTLSELADELSMPIRTLSDHLQIDMDTVSLSQPLGEDSDGAELSDIVPDAGADSPFDMTASVRLEEEVERMFNPLDDREREILSLRFGLQEGGEYRTLDEVGQIMQARYIDLPEDKRYTKEKIRQIEHRAMSKLRHPSSDCGMRDFLL